MPKRLGSSTKGEKALFASWFNDDKFRELGNNKFGL
jgi:hypothetical protein